MAVRDRAYMQRTDAERRRAENFGGDDQTQPGSWSELVGLVRSRVAKLLADNHLATLEEAAALVNLTYQLTIAGNNAYALDRDARQKGDE